MSGVARNKRVTEERKEEKVAWFLGLEWAIRRNEGRRDRDSKEDVGKVRT